MLIDCDKGAADMNNRKTNYADNNNILSAKHRNIILIILCIAVFMASLDVFIVNVALNKIGHSIGQASLSNLSWVLNGYAIFYAALLVQQGN